MLEAHGIGERVAWLEVDLDTLLDLPHGDAPYRPFSRYPTRDIDLAFEVDDAVPASAVEDAIRAAGGDARSGASSCSTSSAAPAWPRAAAAWPTACGSRRPTAR